jgi:hypothetical protein
MPIKAKIPGNHPQPRFKAGTTVRLELKQPPKSILSKSLADMKITISRGIILL